MTTILRVLVKIHDCVARLAPASSRELTDDARATFRSVCRAAADRGRLALVWVGTREISDMASVVVREHVEGWRHAGTPFDAKALAAVSRDARLAMRAMWSARSASLLVAMTLALGIGTAAAVFSVLDSVLLRPVPFPQQDRLVEIWNFSLDQKIAYGTGLSSRTVQAWRQQTDLFDRVEGFERQGFVLSHPSGAEQVTGVRVTPGLLDLLGASPARGRRFLAHEGRAGEAPVALVSHAFWVSHLGRREDLADVSITLDDTRYAVVGVLPASFRFPSGSEQIWIAGTSDQMTPLARLAPQVSHDRAADEVKARGERVGTSAGGPPRVTAIITPTGDSADERTETTLVVLAAAVAFLFLIVCVNVANLTLSRALDRTRDLTTCAALGASRASLFRIVFFEHGILAALGVVAGAGVATLVIDVALWALPEVMTAGTLNAIDLDGRALAMLVATGICTMLVCGLPPAWMATRTVVTKGFSHGGRRTAGSRMAGRLRTALVVTEVALSVALLVGAALITRSFLALTSIDQGYTPEGLVSLRVGLPASGYRDAATASGAMRDVVERIGALPEVAGVTLGELPSERSLMAFGALEFPGRAVTAGPPFVGPIHEVSGSYFQVLQLPIRAGRAFVADEIPGAAIVNERFAAAYFAGTDPVGRRFRIGKGAWRTIVGVAGDTLGDQERASRRFDFYYPLGQAADAARPVRRSSSIAQFHTLLVRSDRPAAVEPLLAAAVHDRDPSIVVWPPERVERIMADAIARPRVAFVTIIVFAGFGLVLAMVGLYGVLSHLVAQRRHEIGVRMALGAGTGNIRRLVLGHGLRLTAVGCALGLGTAWPMVRLMRSLLYDVAAADPASLTAAVALVSLTASVACWAPARNAARTNPVVLLRGE
jgi:putative ABC transport system permease protein